jgi:hypothetical protein
VVFLFYLAYCKITKTFHLSGKPISFSYQKIVLCWKYQIGGDKIINTQKYMREVISKREKGPRPYFRRYAVPDPVQKQSPFKWLMARSVTFVAISALIFSVFIPTTFAATVTWNGNGTDDGVCSDISIDENVDEGRQVWQFNLTSTGDGPNALTASFDDGTTVSGQVQDEMTGPVAKWYIETDAGAVLESATAVDGTANSVLTISHCTVGPTVEEPGDTVTVTIVKYLDGSVATADSADSASFAMHASWDDPTGIGTGEGDFNLSTTGFNNANAYYATTSEMDEGADYSVEELMNSTVAANCDGDEPYALEGYSTGTSLAAAASASISSTAPDFDNLQSDMFVIVHNESCADQPTENDTNLHFIKVVCDEFSDVMGNESGATADASNGHYTEFSNYNGGAFTPSPLVGGFVSTSEIPGSEDGCARADGWQFKLSSDQAQSADVMTTPATAGGASSEYSTLVSALPDNLETAINSGQLWISEVEQDGYDFAAIRCYNDALNGDNLEFISLNGATPDDIYCIAYNVQEDVNPDTVQVTIVKHLDGVLATAETADNAAFPMHASWDDPTGIGTSSGDYTLSNVGFNNASAYHATTSEMDEGADYSTNEVMGDLVGANCDAGKPFALSGYSTGNTYAAAAAGTVSATSPSFTNLQDDMFVVVHNLSCEVLGDVDTNLHFIKVVCDEFSDVAGHEDADNADASGGNFTKFSNYNGGTFLPSTLVDGVVNPSEILGSEDGCARADGWQFKLSSDQGQTANIMITADTSGGEYSTLVSDLPDELETAIMGDGLWVSEVTEEAADFAAIRCYDDALNGDNLEVIRLGNSDDQIDPTDVYCIAYNIGEAQIEPCPDPTQLSVVSGTAAQFIGLVESTTPSPLNDEADYTGGTAGAAVAADDTGYPGAWDAASNDANISGSGAIWVNNMADQPNNPADGGGNGAVDSWRLFEHEFTIPTGSTDITNPATLYFTADNEVTVFLDGVEIASHNDYATVDSVVLPTLTAGTHTLQFAVRNWGVDAFDNPTGLLYNLQLEFCEEDDNGGGGGGGGGGSSSGSRRNNNDNGEVLGDTDFGPGLQMPQGQVLGDTTTVPSNSGEVLGDTLPRTGTSPWALLLVFLVAAPALGYRALRVKKQS